MVEHKGVEEYFAGVLQGSERKAFERHLEKCVVCQGHLRDLRKLDAELRKKLPHAIKGEETPPEWVEDLISKVTKRRRS